MSWVEAASIPEVFLTGECRWGCCWHLNFDICQSAFQVLVVVGQLKKDDNVLVHSGASGVGLAAIQIARAYGA